MTGLAIAARRAGTNVARNATVAIGLTVEVLEDLGTGYRVRIRKES